jgi:hypothetical protein
VRENWPSWSIFPLDDDAAAFTITVHNKTSTNPDDSDGNSDGNGEAADKTIDMDHTRCRLVTFKAPTTPKPTMAAPRRSKRSNGAAHPRPARRHAGSARRRSP